MAKPEKLKLPDTSAVVVEVPAPLKATDAPLPPVIVPEMLKVTTVEVKATPVTLALLIVADRLAGVKVTPVLAGVMV